MKINEIRLGKKVGCQGTDEITITVSPNVCEDVFNEMQILAVATKFYHRQAHYRTLADFFEEAFEAWQVKRRGKVDEASFKGGLDNAIEEV